MMFILMIYFDMPYLFVFFQNGRYELATFIRVDKAKEKTKIIIVITIENIT